MVILNTGVSEGIGAASEGEMGRPPSSRHHSGFLAVPVCSTEMILWSKNLAALPSDLMMTSPVGFPRTKTLRMCPSLETVKPRSSAVNWLALALVESLGAQGRTIRRRPLAENLPRPRAVDRHGVQRHPVPDSLHHGEFLFIDGSVAPDRNIQEEIALLTDNVGWHPDAV